MLRLRPRLAEFPPVSFNLSPEGTGAVSDRGLNSAGTWRPCEKNEDFGFVLTERLYLVRQEGTGWPDAEPLALGLEMDASGA